MQGFYISGDKLVLVGSDEFSSAVLALYYEVVEVQGDYAVRVSQFAVDDCYVAYADEFSSAGTMVISYDAYTCEAYGHAIDYLVSIYNTCNGSINNEH